MHDVKAFIETTLSDALAPAFLEVLNESHMHNVPADAQTHFKVTVVTDKFAGKRLLARHREVNTLLAQALEGPVHALALHTLTPDEYTARGGSITASPQCLGGSKQ